MKHQQIGMLEATADDEINLVELLTDIWKQRWLIASFIAASIIVAVIYLNGATYNYTAKLRVVPAQSSQIGTGKGNGLSGLASMAGLNLPQDPGAMSFQLYTESLHSRSVADALAKRTDLMKVIFSSEWDEKKQRFIEPQPSISTYVVRGIKSLLGLPVYNWRPPGAARLQEYIESNVQPKEDVASPVVTITYEHPDPQFAVAFLTALHHVLDESLRQKALTRSTQYIDYLSAQLQHVTLAEHRIAISNMLFEQEKTKMMASSSLAFSADLFGPVTASIRPTSPRPSLVLAMSVVLGGVLGAFVALMRTQLRKYRRAQNTDNESASI